MGWVLCPPPTLLAFPHPVGSLGGRVRIAALPTVGLVIDSFVFSFLSKDAPVSPSSFPFLPLFLVVSASALNQCLVYVCSDLSVSPEIFLGLAPFLLGEATSLPFRKPH